MSGNIDLTIDESQTFTVSNGVTLTLGESNDINIYGKMDNQGTIQNKGTIVNFSTIDSYTGTSPIGNALVNCDTSNASYVTETGEIRSVQNATLVHNITSMGTNGQET